MSGHLSQYYLSYTDYNYNDVPNDVSTKSNHRYDNNEIFY